jgi:hypothetical protein
MNIELELIKLKITKSEMLDFDIKSITMIAEKTMKPRIIMRFIDNSELINDEIEPIIIEIKKNRRINKLNNVI